MTRTPRDTIDPWRADEAGINGFPALRQVLLGGWLLRFSGGTRRTANSATPLPADGRVAADPPIAAIAAVYRRHNQPAIFRVPSFVAAEIDERLAALGYTAEGESCVIGGDIAGLSGVTAGIEPAAEQVRLLSSPTPEWLAAMRRMQNHTAEQHMVYRKIVSSLMLPAVFAELASGGDSVALAYGVIHDRLLCYESVVTDPLQRRRGHARRVLTALGRWGQQNGATGACLQVEADNTPARQLYHAFGLTTELYRYHYRREPSPIRS